VPTLDLPALQKRIQARDLAQVHLLVGEDVKLVDRIVDAIEATVDPADQPFAVERLYAGDSGGAPADIVNSARVLPMLGDRRLVIVLRAERLLKPKRASKAQDETIAEEEEEPETIDAAVLEEYLARPADTATLVFVATEIDRGRRLTKRVLEKAYLTTFAGLSGDGPAAKRDARVVATQWLKEELTRAGRTIDQEAARLIADRSGGDITKLRGDVERLLLFAGDRTRLSVDDVMEVVAESDAVEDDWAVVNAIADGQPARALYEVGRRVERGDSPHMLIGQLRWWVSSKLADGDPSRVRAALDALLRTDLALKSSGGEERVLLERLVVELTGRPVPRTGWGGGR